MKAKTIRELALRRLSFFAYFTCPIIETNDKT